MGRKTRGARLRGGDFIEKRRISEEVRLNHLNERKKTSKRGAGQEVREGSPVSRN